MKRSPRRSVAIVAAGLHRPSSPLGLGSRILAGAFLLALLLLVRAPAVGAAGYAPNPSFEDDCGGAPCGWSATFNTTISRDTALHHSGAASMRVTHTTPAFGPAIVRATCIAGVSPGGYTVSGWYRSTTAGINVELIAEFFSTSNCSGSSANFLDALETSPGGTAWHRLESAGSADAGTQSVLVWLNIGCPGCSAGTVSNYDDMSLLSNLTPNTGFENDCAGVPCSWNAGFQSAIGRDTTTFRSGSASLSVTPTGMSQGYASTCLGGLAAGGYRASAWYRTSGGVPELNLAFYSSGSCSGSSLASISSVEPAAVDSAWHRLELAGNGPPLTGSARISLGYSCSGCGGTANFDDVALVSDLVPNAGFEENCSGVPCSWTSQGPLLARSTTVKHAGAASIELNGNGIASACFPITSAGSYAASGWYRSTNASDAVKIRVLFRASSDCSGSVSSLFESAESATGDTAWHRLEATGVAPAGTASASVQVVHASVGLINFDDVALTGGTPGTPTAVSVASARAKRAPQGIEIAWRTRSELDVLGFNVWRGPTKLNRRLIRARAGAAGGASYRFVDRSARRGVRYVYRLEVVRLDGSRRTVSRTALRR